MPTVELEPRYFERMGSSLGDKARMVMTHIRGPRVLDVGAGGGELAVAIAEAGFDISVLDASPDAIARLSVLSGLRAVRFGFAEQAPEMFDERFDTIVASAVMHEVYSYGTDPAAPQLCGYDAVNHTLLRFRAALNEGGRLIIRDGIAPSHPGGAARVRGLTADDVVAFHEYMRLTPHPELRAMHLSGRKIIGTRHAIAEFLFTLTWGIETFHREALERYQLFTGSGYQRLLDELGFDLLHSERVTQQGYVDALSRLTVRSGGQDWFPETNGLWVFEKRAS